MNVINARDRFNGRVRAPTTYEKVEPTKTQQHFKNEVNINQIMAKYKRTGMLPTPSVMPQYRDCTGFDFRAAQGLIAEAMQGFAQLPAVIRKRFQNDPGIMLEFLSDPLNREEAEKLGLVARKEVKNVQNLEGSKNNSGTAPVNNSGTGNVAPEPATETGKK